MSSSRPKIVLLTLGDELLLGLTSNSHLSYIGNRLRQGGVRLHSHHTLSDSPEDITRHFPALWEQADALITTGGLGPTADDRTREVIAELLEEPLVFDPEIMAAIERRFDQLGLEVTENNRKQAYRFTHGQAIANPHGTAPGLVLEKDQKLLIMLPGPPSELEPMFEAFVMPELARRGVACDDLGYLQLRTVGIGESALEALLLPITGERPDLEVAFCAHQGMVDVRLGFATGAGSPSALAEIAQACRQVLGPRFLCLGEATLSQVVLDLLRQRRHTLAVAESCTGGLIANELTNLPGASECFAGGLVTYTDAAKTELLGVPEEMIQQHSSVSAEVAIAMATGVAEKLESDYALSATGYLGPGGGSEGAPVGTVFVGLYSPRGVWAKRLFFKGARVVIKRRAFAAALDWLRQELSGDKLEGEDSNSALRAESAEILKSLK